MPLPPPSSNAATSPAVTGAPEPVTLTVTVAAVNDAPVADDQSVSTDEDTSADFDVAGLITEVVRENEPALEGMDAYVCGPPPMVDAAIALLTQRGMDEQHIYYDKFTTTGEPEDEG